MKEQRTSVVWPWLCLLFFLLILAADAPRTWERIARQTGLGDIRKAARPPQQAFSTDSTIAQRVRVVSEPVAAAEPEVRRVDLQWHLPATLADGPALTSIEAQPRFSTQYSGESTLLLQPNPPVVVNQHMSVPLTEVSFPKLSMPNVETAT